MRVRAWLMPQAQVQAQDSLHAAIGRAQVCTPLLLAAGMLLFDSSPGSSGSISLISFFLRLAACAQYARSQCSTVCVAQPEAVCTAVIALTCWAHTQEVLVRLRVLLCGRLLLCGLSVLPEEVDARRHEQANDCHDELAEDLGRLVGLGVSAMGHGLVRKPG